ncbi:MAG: hypothetical protein AB7I50_04310 [Vicinamibacterales bacterium]
MAFNTGVEAGQLTVILAAFLLLGSWASHTDGYRRFIAVPVSAAIALVGLFWTMQRLTTQARNPARPLVRMEDH